MSSAKLEMVKKILDQLASEKMTGSVELIFSEGGVARVNVTRQLI